MKKETKIIILLFAMMGFAILIVNLHNIYFLSESAIHTITIILFIAFVSSFFVAIGLIVSIMLVDPSKEYKSELKEQKEIDRTIGYNVNDNDLQTILTRIYDYYNNDKISTHCVNDEICKLYIRRNYLDRRWSEINISENALTSIAFSIIASALFELFQNDYGGCISNNVMPLIISIAGMVLLIISLFLQRRNNEIMGFRTNINTFEVAIIDKKIKVLEQSIISNADNIQSKNGTNQSEQNQKKLEPNNYTVNINQIDGRDVNYKYKMTIRQE